MLTQPNTGDGDIFDHRRMETNLAGHVIMNFIFTREMSLDR